MASCSRWVVGAALVLMQPGIAEALAADVVEPLGTPAMAVRVTGGEVLGNGRTVVLPAGEVQFEPPIIRELEARGPAPMNYDPSLDAQEMWRSANKGEPGPMALTPRKDENNTSILGGLYRQLQPETVQLSTADGARQFRADEDFKVEPRWAHIANINDRLGKPGEGELVARFRVATQRLDLLQLKDGKLSVKRGEPTLLCPVLPEADEGAVKIAGVYIAPWRRDGRYVVTADDIFPIRQVTAVEPIAPEAVARTRSKLKGGEATKIAFMGDSVTLGAEAHAWWDNLWTEKNLSYASRVVVALRKQFPDAEIEPVLAVKGGTTAQVAAQFFDETVKPAKPDLLVIAFGLNDADGPVGGAPKNSLVEFKAGITSVVQKARDAGMEVILVTPFQPSPFLRNGIAERIASYRQALIEIAQEQHAACADVYAAWMQQAAQGTPPYSQLHNWINHPDGRGHKIYADTVLRFFDPKP